MVSREITVEAEIWPLRKAFTISRGSKTEANVIVVEIRENGKIGRGESVPYPRYNESVEEVIALIQSHALAIKKGISIICKKFNKGIKSISAGNYGGKLGPFHFHLRDIMK